MRGNKLNGILWLIIAVFLLGVLVRGLTGEDYRNMKFWTWHIPSKNNVNVKIHINDKDYSNSNPDEIDSDDVDPADIEDGFVTYSFDSKKINNLDLSTASSSMMCFSSSKADKVEIKISDNIDVRSLYEIKLKGSTLVMNRKPKVNIGVVHDAKEIIVILPETLFDSITLADVSGRITAKKLSARKVEISNVSGRIEAENITGKLKLGTVSGRIVYSTNELKNNLEAESVSGRIEVELPEDADFAADFETVSGSINTDFNKTGKKSGTITNGDRTYDLRFETVSGSIYVNSL
ncbi:MAG: DUF4097 domain-containing protein [Treponema sp.]|nr:DUF4097 domain-containing protein [Treponema sp.]